MFKRLWRFLNKPLFRMKAPVELMVEVDPMVAIRQAKKAERLLEKAMRKPVNDVVLMVQNGELRIDSVFAKIEEKLKGGPSDGRK